MIKPEVPSAYKLQIRYRNKGGGESRFKVDARTLRDHGRWISARLDDAATREMGRIPHGVRTRVSLARERVVNLAEVEMALADLPGPLERQVLGYHLPRGTTSALFQQVRARFPHWQPIPGKKPWFAQMKQTPAAGKSCFAGDTRVATPTGWRAISSLKRGDLILSLTGTGLVPRPVLRVLAHPAEPVWEVRFEQGEKPLRVTGNHRFLTPTGYQRLDSLSVGAPVILVRSHGKPEQSRISALEKMCACEPVFNLITAVENMFVAEGLCAHNFTSFPRLGSLVAGIDHFLAASSLLCRRVLPCMANGCSG